MRYDLTAMTRRAKNPRRASIKIRDIRPPSTFAGDLYRAAYAPVVDMWAGAVDGIVAEYARTLAMTQDSEYRVFGSKVTERLKVTAPTESLGTELLSDVLKSGYMGSNPILASDSPADIEGKIQEAERRFDLLALTITPTIERWALRVEAWTRGKWRGAILSATSVDIGTMIGPADVRQTLQSTIAWNVSLVKDVSAEARRRMSAIIFDGLRGNKPAREVAKELRGVVDLGRARSVRIASDQLAKLTSTLADERRREAGLDAWIWLHSGKLNGRDDHIARDGKRYTDADPPEDMPGQLPFCGCRSQAVLEF